MIKDVMVYLDGTTADETRLAAAERIIELFQGRAIGLYINVLPLLIPVGDDGLSGMQTIQLQNRAREAGDKIEAILAERLNRLGKPSEIHRHDVLWDSVNGVAAREARVADTFVALRPNGASAEVDRLVESVLFGSGRHLFLVPQGTEPKATFEHALVAWDGSREAARAMAEGMPYLHIAGRVTVAVVGEFDDPADKTGEDAVHHLRHHGIEATLHRAKGHDRNAGTILIEAAKQLRADLIVMGGYGHSRMRELLLGGATHEMMHHAPVPLLVAH